MNSTNCTVRCLVGIVSLFVWQVADAQVRGVQRATGVEIQGGITHAYSGFDFASAPGANYTIGVTYWFTDTIGLSGRYVGDNRRSDHQYPADGRYQPVSRWDPGYLTVTVRRRWLFGKHRKGEIEWGAGIDLYNDSREGKAVLTGFVLTEVLGGYMYSDRWGVKGGGGVETWLNRGRHSGIWRSTILVVFRP